MIRGTETVAVRSTFCWNDDGSLTIALDDHEVNLKRAAGLVMLLELLKYSDRDPSPADLSRAAGWTSRHEGSDSRAPLAEFVTDGKLTGLQPDHNEKRIADRVSKGIQATIEKVTKTNGPLGTYFA